MIQRNAPLISICTPTYNRANTLPLLYESLCNQTEKRIEWVLVDDGSTDNTSELVESWIRENTICINYIIKKNTGKADTVNTAVKHARGEFALIIDSDDFLKTNALERMLYHWGQIPIEIRGQFAGIVGLCENKNGEMIGTQFPENIIDSDNVEIHYRYKVRGDKTNFYQKTLLRKHPYPVIEGEKRMAPSFVWNKLAINYKTRFVNEVWVTKDYLATGWSKNLNKIRKKSPVSSMNYYQTVLKDHPAINIVAKLRLCANYVRYSAHCKTKMKNPIKKSIAGTLVYMFALPIGVLLYMRDPK